MRRVALSDAIKLAHNVLLTDTHLEEATGYEIPDLLIQKEGPKEKSPRANVVTTSGFEKSFDHVSLDMLGNLTDEIETARREYYKYIADGPGASASDVDPFQRGFMAGMERTFKHTYELILKSEEQNRDKRRKILEDYVTNLGERAVISHKTSYNSVTDLLYNKKKTPQSLIYGKPTDDIIQKFREVASDEDPRERSWFNLAIKLGYKFKKEKGQANKKFKKLVEVCTMLCLPVEILDKKKKPGPKGRE